MKNGIKFLIIILILIGVFILSNTVYKRFDATKDKRYTLTQTSKNILQKIEKPLTINILLGGELTGDYRILKNEIGFLLDEFKSINPKISYQFINPSKDLPSNTLEENQLTPVPIKIDGGTLNIYPYAQIIYNNKKSWMETLVNDPAIPLDELALESTEKLEYLFMEDIRRITQTNRKNVGFIVHHDELPQQNIDGFGRALSEKYNVDVYLNPIIDSSFTLKVNDLDSLKKFDALIIAKPTLPFSDMDKLVLDQYIMNGGKTLWMTESVDAEMDSIFRSGKIVAFPRELNLNDFFFNYGIRIIPAIVKDLDASKIVLADGETTNGNVSYNYYTWPYFLRGFKAQENPITQSINTVRFEFANAIEPLDNPNVKQTFLLSTSAKTSFQPQLSFIELNEVANINPEEYQMGKIPLAVLLEGNFKSAYATRYESKEFPNFKNSTVDGKMIVISDGDVAKNHVLLGKPMRLGEDKYTLRPDNKNQRPITYDNQTFLLNSLDYLLGEKDFLYLRNRKLEIPLLNDSKVTLEKKQWQFANLLIPILFLWFIGGLMIFLRKKKFTKKIS